ncbi:MAG: TIGR02646 family protein [Butyrivibrio sp.]|nr:TIGR02646 family protein [Butyrivibrio sp.]
MRKISKGVSPKWFENWKEDYHKNNGVAPMYDDLDIVTRRKLRKELAIEQGYICCYCMKRIEQDGSHIEHFRPREKYGEESLEYDNMFASCDGDEKEAQQIYWHCDTKKDNWFDERMPKPTDADYERCVKYHIDGKVSPFHECNDSRYEIEKSMIKHLGLDALYLIRNRRKAIEASELMDEAEYTVSDFMDFIRYYDVMHCGRYEEYCGVIIYLMNELIS